MSNIRPYVIINGVDSRTIQGLLITSLPPISKPAQRTLTETIDGRDGDSSIKLGYSAYDKSLGIALTFGYNVDDIISFFNSEGTIVFSNEPDKLYNFEIFEAIDFEKLIRFKTATVTIHTQPFKFSNTENPLEFTEKEFTVVNNGNTDSRPNLVITGEGLATMQINGKNALNIDFGDAEQTLLIDSEGMNAYHTNNIKSVIVDVLATGGNGTPDNPNPINGYSEVNIVNTQNESIADLFSIDSDFRGIVAFNQLIQNGNFESTSGWNNGYHAQNFSVSNNEGTFEATGLYSQITGNSIGVVTNHVYLCHGFAKCTNNRKLAIGTTSIGYTYIDITNVYSELNALKKVSASNSESVIITSSNSVVGDVFSVKNINIIDLTQMFGSTIADYIYSLEQATAGAGVAFFRSIYPADYYDYDSGTNELVGKVIPTAIINLGQTVYGGVLDVTRGKLRVDRKLVVLDGTQVVTVASNAYIKSDACNGYVTINDISPSVWPTEQPDGIKSDKLSFVKQPIWSMTGYPDCFTINNKQVHLNISNSNLGIVDYTQETLASVTTKITNFLSNNNVSIIYSITPFDIDLTPVQIEALLGVNNVYSNTGNVTVIFVNDGQDETQTGGIVTFDLDESDLNKGDLANRLVSGNYANIRLKTGSNAIKFIGSVSAVGLDKYSRWL